MTTLEIYNFETCLPHAASDGAAVVYANELVTGGGHVKIRLLLIDEERVRHPDVPDKLWADAQRFDARGFLERQPWIRPKLSEVKIQSEVLFYQVINVNWLIKIFFFFYVENFQCLFFET